MKYLLIPPTHTHQKWFYMKPYFIYKRFKLNFLQWLARPPSPTHFFCYQRCKVALKREQIDLRFASLFPRHEWFYYLPKTIFISFFCILNSLFTHLKKICQGMLNTEWDTTIMCIFFCTGENTLCSYRCWHMSALTLIWVKSCRISQESYSLIHPLGL